MKKLNVALNGLLIALSLYTLLSTGMPITVLFIAIWASAIATTMSYQKKPLAWFAFVGNAILFCTAAMFGVMGLADGLPVKGSDGVLMGGAILLLMALPCALNVFFIKIRYFPARVKSSDQAKWRDCKSVFLRNRQE